MRRPMADATARRAKPESLDLAPWRRGPKHRSVVAHVPLRADWLYQGRPNEQRLRFSLPNLRASIRAGDGDARQLQAYLREVLTGGKVTTVSEVNSLMLAKCQVLYPKPRTIPNKPSTSSAVIRSIDRMWSARVQSVNSAGKGHTLCDSALSCAASKSAKASAHSFHTSAGKLASGTALPPLRCWIAQAISSARKPRKLSRSCDAATLAEQSGDALNASR